MVVSAIAAIRMVPMEMVKQLTAATNVGAAEKLTVADFGETRSTELV